MPLPRSVVSLLACACLAGCSGPDADRADADPPPPPPPPSNEREVDQAEFLLARHGCAACHAPGAAARVAPWGAPSLEDAGARLSPEFLLQQVSDPHASRTHAAMPDLLGPPGPERDEAALDLVHFLAARGGPLESDDTDVDPGVDPGVDPLALEEGRQLFHAIGCVACHAPLEVPEDLELPLWAFAAGWEEDAPARLAGAMPLDHLPQKTSARALAQALSEPHATWPSGRMPSFELTPREARSLAAYLTTPEVRVGRASFEEAPGLRYESYEAEIDSLADFEGAEVAARGVTADLAALPEHRDEHFAFRFHGFVDVPAAGTWTFALASDDGSWLWIDGELRVDHGGTHAMTEKTADVRLAAGRHALEVRWYEWTGDEGLALEWSGPGREREPIPAEVLSHWERAQAWRAPANPVELDPERARRGAERFDALGCAACHPLSDRPAPAPAMPLAELDTSDGRGCLEPEPRTGRPHYALAPYERGLLGRTLAHPELLRTPGSERDSLARDLARLGCTACHERDGGGGPPAAMRPYFRVASGLDLGDEGRLPPRLDGVGAKLTRAALDGVLLGTERVRPYVKTRMPRYHSGDVELLPTFFHLLDAAIAGPSEPAFDVERVETGRHLAGTRGLGCIQCHVIGDYPSLGIPAVDLATMQRRIRWPWFRRLMLDPRTLDMNTRMPIFWGDDGLSPVRDVLAGDPELQTAAVWSWLGLGDALPLPEGLLVPEGTYELVPVERPILVGVFMKDVGPRTLAVGTPERVHWAFDLEESRLARLWRGRFFDARGTWHGRAGTLEVPPADDVLDLPRGVPFAYLADLDEPWPGDRADDLGYRVLGRRMRPDGLPTFRYALGAVTIEETVHPRLAAGGATVVRELRVTAAEPTEDLWLRIAEGRLIARGADDTWTVEGAWSVTPIGMVEPVLRERGERREVLIPVDAAPGRPFEIALEVSW